MLLLDRPIGIVEGLQIFRDHADAGLFYYVPERPRLAMNGDVPEFVFIKYARDLTDNPDFTPEQKVSLGGGLLAFTVDLSVEEEVLDRVRARLGSLAGAPVLGIPRLSPLMAEGGSVRLSMMSDNADDEPELAAPAERAGIGIFEKVFGTTKPSLFGNNRATFGMILGQEQATLMEAALKAGVGYIGVIYDLEFLGMRPTYNVRVTAEYKRVYDHFEAELGAHAQIYAVRLQADLAAGYQKLIDEGAIKIEVTHFTDRADMIAQAEAAKTWALQQITSDLFRSSLQPPSFMTRTSTSPLQALASLMGSFTGGQSARNTIASAPARSRSANEDSAGEAAPRPARAEPPSDLRSSDHVENPPPEPENAERPNETDVVPSREEGGEPARPAATPAANTGGGSGARGGVSDVMPAYVGLSLRFFRQEELRKRVFEFSQQGAERHHIYPQGLLTTVIDGRNLSERIIEVDLDDDFFKILDLEVRTVTDWEHEGIELITVSVEYPGELRDGEEPQHADGFVFSATDASPKRFLTRLNEAKTLGYRYRADVHFKANSPFVGQHQVLRGSWTDERMRPLAFNALDSVGLLILTVAADATVFKDDEITQAVVALDYTDADAGLSVSDSFVLKPAEQTKVWRVRLTNSARRSYSFTVEYAFRDGSRLLSPRIESDEPSLTVSSPFAGRKKVRVVPHLDASELVEAVVDVVYAERDRGYARSMQVVFNSAPLASQEIEFGTLVPSPEAEYSYRITVIQADGTVFEGAHTPSTAGVIVVGPRGDAGARRIQLQVVGQPETLADLLALEVQLRRAAGDEIQAEVFAPGEVRADPGPDTARTVWLPIPATEALRYEFRWIGYGRDGTPRESGWATGEDTQLVVSVGLL